MARGDNGVGPKTREFTAQLGFEIGINSQRYGGNSCNHANRKQSCKCAVFAHPGGLDQQAHEQGAAAHASPRSTTAGSKCMALRIAPELPAKATSSALKITMASTTGWTTMAEPNIVCPMRCAIKAPAENPTIPPPRASKPASVK